jgi:methane/ammonia monooxygenase subunit B
MIRRILAAWILLSLFSVDIAYAHGERAQQAGLRMRTVHWFDTQISTEKLDVNGTVTITGTFVPSKYWPEHMAGPDGTAYLNVGIPGPVFVRVDSSVNGIPMIRSTQFHKGETYKYSMTLKARTPGRYHIHPVLSVKDTGPVIGPGFWVDVGGSQADFVNNVTTLTGETIDLETYGMSNILGWSGLWFAIGLVWFIYWLTKCPIIIPRYRKVAELGDSADEIITPTDKKVAAVTLAVTFSLIGGGYFWAQSEYPVTTPLQTGKVHVPPYDDSASRKVSVKVDNATYRIPGRSFELKLTVHNGSDRPVRVARFTTANIRFVNPDVLSEKAKDAQDLVAPDGLRSDVKEIQPGETRQITIHAEDALWETYRLTSLIYDPDSRFGGMLFFMDDQNRFYYSEIGGNMIPVFS